MVVGRWLTDTRCYALTRVHTRFALSLGSLHEEVSRHDLRYKQEQEMRSILFVLLQGWWREEIAGSRYPALGCYWAPFSSLGRTVLGWVMTCMLSSGRRTDEA
jgi:hypothetical protein